MHAIRHVLATLIVLGAISATLPPAHAAESYDNCTGFITTLPATISTQGTWCLNQNLGTAVTSGNAITIATNNVTIDCNDFKIGGLGAGNSTQARGIFAGNRSNATVRHCNVRGFYTGIDLDGGSGHLVEDNRLDNNVYTGISVTGVNSLVRHNAVYDTGGFPGSNVSRGINTAGDVIGNTVSGVFVDGGSATQGIVATGDGVEVRGNRVRGVVPTNTGFSAVGILVNGSGTRLERNHVSAEQPITGYGILFFQIGGGGSATTDFCTNNTVANFSTASYSGCDANLGNLSL